jgi:hypothetical protein
MRKLLLNILFLFFTASVSAFNYFDVKNINDTVSIRGNKYYEVDFDFYRFSDLEKNKSTYTRFISNPLKDIYNVDVNTDSVICTLTNWDNSISKTILLKDYFNGKTIKGFFISDIVYVPYKKEVQYKKRLNHNITDGIDKNVFDNSLKYSNEIDSMKGSSTREYKEFLKRKSIGFYNNYNKVEDAILHISLYISTIVEYDLDYTMSQDDIKEVLDNRKGVCAGYTELFSIMLDTIAKVDDRVGMLSTMTFSENRVDHESDIFHICNLIEIDGYLYQHDVTNMVVKFKEGEYSNMKNEYNYYLRKNLKDYYKIMSYNVSYLDDMDDMELFYTNFNTDINTQKYLFDKI